MKGTSEIREQGYKDPLLVKVMRAHGFEELPLYKHRPPEQQAQRQRWFDLAKQRDGLVNPLPVKIDDIDRAAAEIKALARDIGADDVGITRLTPVMIRQGLDLPHDHVSA